MEPMEGEIIDLNRANMLNSQIICLQTQAGTDARIKYKWESVRTEKVGMCSCVSSGENVRSPILHECI